MLFPGWIYIAQGPWHLKDFCNIFLPHINEDQKKSYYLRQLRRWRGGAARPGCHHFGVTPYYDVKL